MTQPTATADGSRSTVEVTEKTPALVVPSLSRYARTDGTNEPSAEPVAADPAEAAHSAEAAAPEEALPVEEPSEEGPARRAQEGRASRSASASAAEQPKSAAEQAGQAGTRESGHASARTSAQTSAQTSAPTSDQTAARTPAERSAQPAAATSDETARSSAQPRVETQTEAATSLPVPAGRLTTSQPPPKARVPFWKRLTLQRDRPTAPAPDAEVVFAPILDRLGTLERNSAAQQRAAGERVDALEESLLEIWEAETQARLAEIREQLALLVANQEEIADGLHSVSRSLSWLLAGLAIGLAGACGLAVHFLL